MNRSIRRFILMTLGIVAAAVMLAGCNSKVVEPKDYSTSLPGVAPIAEWDPEVVLPPGLNLLTFTLGDKETSFPYYMTTKTYPIKYIITTGAAQEGALDPGVYSVRIEYKKTGEENWTVLQSGAPASSDKVYTYDWNMASVPEGSGYLVKVTARSVAGVDVSAVSTASFGVDSGPPAFSKFELTAGALGVAGSNAVNRSFFSVSLAASDATSPITAYCFKVNETTAPADATDSCWVRLDAGVSANSIDLQNLPTFVGFVDGGYVLRAWVMDQAGNISVMSSGVGVVGKDRIDFSYNSAVAPVLSNIVVNNNDSNGTLPISTETVFTEGQDVYVKWKVTDTDLVSYPLSVYYTLDEQTFIPVEGASNLINAAGSGCSIDANYTGCFVFPAPTDKYFRVQVRAVDLSGLVSTGGSQGLNLGNFGVVTGNTDLGLGGSANKAVFFHRGGGSVELADAGILAVANDGKIYFLDSNRGVLLVDPTDGVQKLYLKRGSQSAGDGGPVADAMTLNPQKITLDYQDRLLILEQNRIRRVELDGSISTLIGGGDTYDPSIGVPARSYKFPVSISADYAMFTVLPNGNIWFASSSPLAKYADFALAVYKASEDKVYTLKLSGKGAYGNPERINTEDGSYVRSTPGLVFNYRTSSVDALTIRFCKPVPGGCSFWNANFNPRTGQNVGYGVHYNYIASWNNQPYATSRRGRLYGISAWTSAGIYRHNPNSNVWERIVGTGTNGQCSDDTLATACPVDPASVWITLDNVVYFVDRGTVRVVLPDGKVKTVFGQSKTFGNGGSPLSARYSHIRYFGPWGADDKVVLYDQAESYLKEVSQGPAGVVTMLSGNGSAGATPMVSGKSQAAANLVAYNPQYWGHSTGIAVNPFNGEVYSGLGATYLMTLKRNGGDAGKWVAFAGGSGGVRSSFLSRDSDNKTGSQIYLTGYSVVVTGIGVPSVEGSTSVADKAVENGSAEPYIMATAHRWNGSCHVDPFMKLVRVSDGMLRFVMGKKTDPTCTSGSLPGAGQDLSNFANFPYWHSNSVGSHYLSEDRAWLLSGQNMKTIVKIPFARDGSDLITSGGTSATFATLPKNLNAFAYRKECSNYVIYYCAVDGSLNKFNVTTKVNTAISLPSSSVTGSALYQCTGRVMHMDRAKENLMFVYTQNSLMGIGKYKLDTLSCP